MVLRREQARWPPLTRGDCINGPRPCPWENCRYHLANLERYGKLTLRRVNIPETCSLDAADRGPHSLREVGRLMGLDWKHVSRIEASALERCRIILQEQGFQDISWFGE